MSFAYEIEGPRRALAVLAQASVYEDTTLSASFTPQPIWGSSVLTGIDMAVGTSEGKWCTGLMNLGGAYANLTLFHRQTATGERSLLYSWRGELLIPLSTYLELAVACESAAALGILAYGYCEPYEAGFLCTPF